MSHNHSHEDHEVYYLPHHTLELAKLKCEGFILDIGGGGEGVIGKLNGPQVIAIDPSKEELAETQNNALKIVMDASELFFLDNSLAQLFLE